MGVYVARIVGDDGVHPRNLLVTNGEAHVRASFPAASLPLPVQIVQMLDNLSASTDGAPVAVAATASPGTIIHTVPQGEKHLVFMQVSNISTTGKTLTLQWGGVAVAQEMDFEVPANGSIQIALGDLVDAASANFVIRAYVVGGANTCNIRGHVEKL